MTTFSSALVDITTNIVTNLAPEAQEPAPAGSSWLISSLTGSTPNVLKWGIIKANVNRYAGELWKMYGALFWFERVHIVPLTYALGNVISALVKTYEVYNGWRYKYKHLLTITPVNAGGFSFSGDLATSPRLMQPKQSFIVTANINPAGPVTIAASVVYVFDGGESLTITFTGKRVIVMSVEPQSNIVETWEWLTDIIESGSGNEQRISNRDMPRQSFTYQYLKEDESSAFLENLLFGWANNIWAVPVWTDHIHLTAATVAGTTLVLSVDSTTNRDFRTNAGSNLIAIWNNENSFEAAEVVSFTSTTITISSVILAVWPKGAVVVPLRLSYMTEPSTAVFQNVNARNRQLRFTAIANKIPSFSGSPAPLQAGGLYRSRPFWDITNDELITAGSYNVIDDKQIRTIGGETGKLMTNTTKKFPVRTVSGVGMTSYGRSEFVRMREFLLGARGRQRSFWLETGNRDFKIESTSASGALNVNVVPCNYTNQVFGALGGPRTRKDIIIRYANGATDKRRIVASSETIGVREVLVLDSVLSQTCSTANVTRISYLILHRMGSDSVILNHERVDGDVSAPVTLVSVYDE